MPPVTMTARVPVLYAGRRYVSGESFLAQSRADALVLQTLGRASAIPVEADDEPALPRPKRVYRRRNLTAQDTQA